MRLTITLYDDRLIRRLQSEAIDQRRDVREQAAVLVEESLRRLLADDKSKQLAASGAA